MDGFFEKLGIYDFFNLIASGVVFLLGLVALDFLEFGSLTAFGESYSGMEWVIIVAALGGCYLIGVAFQQIANIIFEKKYCKKITSTILCNRYSILDNPIKLRIHQNGARELFHRKKISFTGNCFSAQYCNYYFSYCSYYIQNQGKHQKTEKIRGLRGIYSLLVVCFFLLCIISICKIIIALINSEPYIMYIGIALIFLAMYLLSINAYRESLKDWVKMILGVYEVCVDIDLQERPHKT